MEIQMIKPHVFTLTWIPGDQIYADKHCANIFYGPCMRSHHMQQGLWYVTITLREITPENKSDTFSQHNVTHTFLLKEKYISRNYFEKTRRDLNKWRKVSCKEFIGPWCVECECLWADVPIFEHTLNDGKVLKYGLCRTQSKDHPDRELWFVSMKSQFYGERTFVVDKFFAQPNIMEIFGAKWLNHWEDICWREFSHKDVDYMMLGTPGDRSYVRFAECFAVQMPRSLKNVDDAEAFIRIVRKQ